MEEKYREVGEVRINKMQSKSFQLIWKGNVRFDKYDIYIYILIILILVALT